MNELVAPFSKYSPEMNPFPYISHLKIKIHGKQLGNSHGFFSSYRLLNHSGFIFFHSSFQSLIFGKITETMLVIVIKNFTFTENNSGECLIGKKKRC